MVPVKAALRSAVPLIVLSVLISTCIAIHCPCVAPRDWPKAIWVCWHIKIGRAPTSIKGKERIPGGE